MQDLSAQELERILAYTGNIPRRLLGHATGSIETLRLIERAARTAHKTRDYVPPEEHAEAKNQVSSLAEQLAARDTELAELRQRHTDTLNCLTKEQEREKALARNNELLEKRLALMEGDRRDAYEEIAAHLPQKTPAIALGLGFSAPDMQAHI
ncbi:MAG: hypothetical protein ACOCWQ_01990, partial [Nanoarchaeota archaeon]